MTAVQHSSDGDWEELSKFAPYSESSALDTRPVQRNTDGCKTANQGYDEKDWQ